jgi:endonuclease/exonuclease/phosphatase family metal-dependent hydrolase
LSQRRFRITEFPTGLDAAVDGVALHYENLDHILVSQEFYDRNPERIAEVSDLRYFNDHLVDSQRSDDRGDRIVSDHAQLVADVRLRPPSD